MSFIPGRHGVITFHGYLSLGTTLIDLMKGEAENLDPNATIKRVAFNGGNKFNMGRIKSISIFTDAEVHVDMSNGELENDMFSFIRSMRPVNLENIRLKQEFANVPDKYLVLIVASDDPAFDYVSTGIPHLFYTNEITAISLQYRNLFLRHTLGKKNKFKIFNGAVDINLDIQHRETPETDTNDEWVSYDGFPQVLAASGDFVFGDDTARDTQHHFHRVRVQSTAADVVVKGAHFNI